MILKDDGLKFAKLIHVSVENGKTAQSNKVYIMEELNDGRIKCEYGRVGKELKVDYKPSSKWGSVYKQKTGRSKGYTDVTEMIAEVVSDVTNKAEVKDITDKIVKKLFDELMAFANKAIQQNYKVTQDAVTQVQVDAAQEVLDKTINKLKVGVDIKEVNDLLMKLYTIIPRKMKDVRDHLLSDIDNRSDLGSAKEFLSDEQDTLDTMAGQVKLLKQQTVTNDEDDNDLPSEITLLEQIGLEVEIETDKESLKLINKLLGNNANQAVNIFKCVNTKTQKIFDDNFEEAKVKKRRLYWHGSRNSNWFNIIQTGLMIRPAGAIHTGSMWDSGVYFANDVDKSLGYTDGGRWVGGKRIGKVYLGLFDVHVGKQLHRYKHDNSSYNISKEIKNSDFDSVYAHKGVSLRKDEFIVYSTNQCTITHLIEYQF